MSNLGHALRQGGEERAAINIFQGIIELKPDPRRVGDWGHFAQLLYHARRLEEARESLEKTIEMRGDEGPTLKWGPRWWYYTMTLCRLGEADRAREIFEQLVELLREDPPANKRLHDRLRAEAAELLEIDTELAKNEKP